MLLVYGAACGSATTNVAPIAAAGSDIGHDHAAHQHGNHAFTDADQWTKVFDDPARDEWQRPNEVLRAMELTPSMVVADIGAGTGYFSVRFARAVPQGAVIATDIEPDMVRFLTERAGREQLPNLRAIRSTAATTGLAANSVDRILVVDVWHHLSDRTIYLRDLLAALRPNGRVFIVDFTAAAKHGPPAAMRLAPEQVIAELEAAGLTAVISPIQLPDQYIIEAQLASLQPGTQTP